MRLVDGEIGLDAQGKLADDTTKDLVYTEGDSPLLEGGGTSRGHMDRYTMARDRRWATMERQT